MATVELPEPYVDCVIRHKNGSQRIGRLNHKKTHFQLSSYQPRRVEVVWAVADITDVKVIEMFPIGGSNV